MTAGAAVDAADLQMLHFERQALITLPYRASLDLLLLLCPWQVGCEPTTDPQVFSARWTVIENHQLPKRAQAAGGKMRVFALGKRTKKAPREVCNERNRII